MNEELAVQGLDDNQEQQKITFTQAMELVGNGRLQIVLLFLCGLSWANDAIEMVQMSFLLPIFKKSWALSDFEVSALSSSVYIGSLIGAYVWGVLSDKIGRRLAFNLTVLIVSGFGLLSAFMPSMWFFFVVRIFVGFGLGGNLPIDQSMFLEYLAPKRRGFYSVLLTCFWPIGVMINATVSILFLGVAVNNGWLTVNWAWRAMVIINSTPGFILLLFRSYIPESPIYLLDKGDTQGAWKVIQYIAKFNKVTLPDIQDSELVPRGEGRPKMSFKASALQSATFIIKLFSTWKLALSTLLLWTMWFCALFGYWGISTWLPTYMEKKGVARLNIYVNFLIIGLAQCIGCVFLGLVVDKIGRKATIFISYCLTGICIAIYAFVDSFYISTVLAVVLSVATQGGASGSYTITPEVYPTEIRATGVGASFLQGRIAATIAPFLGGMLMNVQFFIPLILWSCMYFIASFAAVLIPVETKATNMSSWSGSSKEAELQAKPPEFHSENED